jgi:type II secretory pathway component GspD/PulD (secretin)
VRNVLGAALALLIAGGSAAVAASPPAHRISLQAQNEPVQSVLLRVARAGGVSISVGQSVTGYVTVAVRNVTVDDALKAVLGPLHATFHRSGSIYDVEPAAGAPAAAGLAPAVLPVTTATVKRAAAQLRALFPQAAIREDVKSNSLIVVAAPADVQAMRTVLQGIDVKSPMESTTEAVALRTLRAEQAAVQLHRSFPAARISAVGAKQLLVTATPADLLQIKAAVAALDAPPATPPPVAMTSEAVRIVQRRPADVARSLAAEIPGLRAAVSGSTVLLAGPPDAVTRGKALIAQLDVPSSTDRYTQIYRIRSLDAASVATLLRRSFRDLEITVDASINAIAVTATTAQQQRIADALAQLDAAPAGTAAAAAGGGSFAESGTEVITLKSAVPGQTTGGTDAVNAITQALAIVAPDVKVVQLPTPGQVALVGPPPSVRAAREFIGKVDVVAPQVVLDTEILELDESVAKNLGVQLGAAVISSTFTEMQPTPDPNGGAPRLGAFQALTRTPISFTAQINLAVANGRGRVLADPRITTLSGRTASIRAGDTISILTTTAGNAGTIATTQVQSFQTGVTLDITPLVDSEGGITVALHPVVNSLIGTNAGVPEISTRDTQTTVHLRDNETLVIGGLIQENDSRTTTKIPLLGDIPLVGRVFRNDQVNNARNELIIVVTPHVVAPGTSVIPGPALRALPSPQPLPTLPPNAQLPPPSGQLPQSVAPPLSRRSRAPGASASGTVPPLGTVLPSSTVAPSSAVPSAAPEPAPTAFAATNVFTFGAAPQSNFAKSTDPVQIFYATLSPTLVSNGTAVRVAAITTTNANAVKLQVGSQQIRLAQTGPGQWQAAFPFPASAVPTGVSALTLALTASRLDGGAATISIPVNLAAP